MLTIYGLVVAQRAQIGVAPIFFGTVVRLLVVLGALSTFTAKHTSAICAAQINGVELRCHHVSKALKAVTNLRSLLICPPSHFY